MLKKRYWAACLTLALMLSSMGGVLLCAAGPDRIERIQFRDSVLELAEALDMGTEEGVGNFLKLYRSLDLLGLDVDFFADSGTLLIYDYADWIFAEDWLDLVYEDVWEEEEAEYDNTPTLDEISWQLKDFVLPTKELLVGGWLAEVDGDVFRLYFTEQDTSFALELDAYAAYTVSGDYHFDEEGLLVFVFRKIYENGIPESDTIVVGEVWYLSDSVRISPDGQYLFMEYGDDFILVRDEDTDWLKRYKFE